jgi:hypothetical protein
VSKKQEAALMETTSPTQTTPTWMIWTGRVISALPVLLLAMSGVMKVMQPPEVLEGMAKSGWDLKLLIPLAIVEIVCTVIYVIPQTAVLGAILLTGYLGGATATHVRQGESVLIPVGLGVLVWLGLYLRDARVRSLAPWRYL